MKESVFLVLAFNSQTWAENLSTTYIVVHVTNWAAQSPTGTVEVKRGDEVVKRGERETGILWALQPPAWTRPENWRRFSVPSTAICCQPWLQTLSKDRHGFGYKEIQWKVTDEDWSPLLSYQKRSMKVHLLHIVRNTWYFKFCNLNHFGGSAVSDISLILFCILMMTQVEHFKKY